MPPFSHRLAETRDLAQLRTVMALAIARLQHGFLSPEQIEASQQVMGLDTQLIADRTYFLVEDQAGAVAGCGGWSFRATLYGGDASIVARTPQRLDPARDAAKIRAMYTHPDFARRGVGRCILGLCEDAARAAGFARAEMMATMAGEPLYAACGYQPVEPILSPPIGGVRVPLVRMEKRL